MVSQKKILLVTIIALSAVLPLNAQYENLLHKSFYDKYELLVDLYNNKLRIFNSDTSYSRSQIAHFTAFAEKSNDPTLVREAELIKVQWIMAHGLVPEEEFTLQVETLAKKCVAEKDYISACRLYRVMGSDLFNRYEKYEAAFDAYFKLMQLQPYVTDKEYPEKCTDYIRLGYAFYFFNDFPTAIIYLKQSLQYKPHPARTHQVNDAFNTIGLCYQKMGKLDSAEYFFIKVLEAKETGQYNQWKGIANGNLGYNAYLKKEYDKAIPLLKTDIDTAIAFRDYGLAAGSLIPLADIYMKQNRKQEAGPLIFKAKEFIEKSGKYIKYEQLYPLLSSWYGYQSNQMLAKAYMDSALTVKDSLDRKFSALQLLRAQQRMEINNRQAAIAKVEAEKASKTMQRNFLIVLLLISMLAALFINNLIRRRNRQAQLVSTLKLQKAEQELASASEQLNIFARNISEKNRMVEELEHKILKQLQPDNALLYQLQQSTVLTDSDWEHFRDLFEKVHSGYLFRLRQKLPDLSPAETRYMAFAKLKFSNKEMASALGVSQQAIRVILHRLRKKLKLPEEGAVDELVNSI